MWWWSEYQAGAGVRSRAAGLGRDQRGILPNQAYIRLPLLPSECHCHRRTRILAPFSDTLLSTTTIHHPRPSYAPQHGIKKEGPPQGMSFSIVQRTAESGALSGYSDTSYPRPMSMSMLTSATGHHPRRLGVCRILISRLQGNVLSAFLSRSVPHGVDGRRLEGAASAFSVEYAPFSLCAAATDQPSPFCVAHHSLHIAPGPAASARPRS